MRNEHDEPLHPDDNKPRDLTKEGVGFVDRQKLKADGDAYNKGRHWSGYDYHLYATAEGALAGFRRHRRAGKRN